ncbi:LegC family aminotransferase [Paenibacillus cymbidii]|uniref:LegC family aminotransferase n=1 Tax=Paenibacillus cymbidii TaxID=1639034 RepID=UPI0010816CD2|nr:LegC family aminotransferase [Paenibacillus cymbidii]
MNQTAWMESVRAAIEQVLPDRKPFTPLHEPYFAGNEWEYVKSCLDTGWVSSVGEYVTRFGQELAAYTGAKYAIPVVNGTAALQICLLLAGVETGDEVLIPSLSFVATANAVAYCGAIPHFVDSEERSLGIDAAKLERYLTEIAIVEQGECRNRLTGRKIKALVPMHTFGHPVDLDPLLAICDTYNLELIEDAAESLGSSYKGVHTGNFGKLAALSFNGNKVITTGGGGAILTNDEFLAREARHLTTTAKVPHEWAFIHDRVGYNYRLPNLNAALGCAQLEQLPRFLDQKRQLADRYREALRPLAGISFLEEPNYARSNYWLNALVLDRPLAAHRDELLRMLNDAGLMSRPLWEPLHRLPMYDHCPRMPLETAESLAARVVNIPSSPQLMASHTTN